jgi:hypothetical protein
VTNCEIEGGVNVHDCAIDEYDVIAFEDRECFHRVKRQRQFRARQADYWPTYGLRIDRHPRNLRQPIGCPGVPTMLQVCDQFYCHGPNSFVGRAGGFDPVPGKCLTKLTTSL